MNASHADLKGGAGAYVLGSLDPDDRAAFEAHLAECPECTDEVRSLRHVAGVLASAVPQRTPQPELRDRVLASISTSAAATVPRPTVGHPSPAGARGSRSWLPAAALVALAIGIGAYAVRLQMHVADLSARLDEAQSSMGVLAAPDLARIDLAGQAAAPAASGRALWSRARGLVFTASNLPPAPSGRVYQLWVVTADAPVSAGLLSPDASGGETVFFSTPPDMPDPVAVAVTLEPAGGVPAPTGDRYLVGAPGTAL